MHILLLLYRPLCLSVHKRRIFLQHSLAGAEWKGIIHIECTVRTVRSVIFMGLVSYRIVGFTYIRRYNHAGKYWMLVDSCAVLPYDSWSFFVRRKLIFHFFLLCFLTRRHTAMNIYMFLVSFFSRICLRKNAIWFWWLDIDYQRGCKGVERVRMKFVSWIRAKFDIFDFLPYVLSRVPNQKKFFSSAWIPFHFKMGLILKPGSRNKWKQERVLVPVLI